MTACWITFGILKTKIGNLVNCYQYMGHVVRTVDGIDNISIFEI